MMLPQIKVVRYATDLSKYARNAFDYAALRAERLTAKLIVAPGSHGMGILANATMGSIARREPRRSKTPVLSVRH